MRLLNSREKDTWIIKNKKLGMDAQDWITIITSIVVVLAGAVSGILNSRKAKERAVGGADNFAHHLDMIGIRAEPVEDPSVEAKKGDIKGSTFRLHGSPIDQVSIVPAGNELSVVFLIPMSGPSFSKKKRTFMKRVKTKIGSDIIWKGDPVLAQTLNFDFTLNQLLSQVDPKELKTLVISPLKTNRAEILTNYFLPPKEMFKALDIIAGHLRSW